MNKMYASLFDESDAILRVNERQKKYHSLQDENPVLNLPASFQFLPPQKSEKPYTISQINDGIGRILESGNTRFWNRTARRRSTGGR